MMRMCILAVVAVLSWLIVPMETKAEELVMDAVKILSARDGQIPQAPRVSPDGSSVVFEYTSKKKTVLWHAAVDGKTPVCLTCDQGKNFENGYWHPSGRYIVFNEVPEGSLKQNGIFTAALKNGKLGPLKNITFGARPQFSKPNGHVIFFEASAIVDNQMNNVLAYQIIGKDPLSPAEEKSLELRGPIQRIQQAAEISHPSLAPDGTTIVFAARAINLKTNSLSGVILTDVDRQKVYKLWQALIPVDREKINIALQKAFTAQDPPAIGNQENFTRDDFKRILSGRASYAAAPTIVPGYSEWHLFLTWVLGLLDKLDDKFDAEVQEMIFPRLWITDVFGAPIVPLVKDLTSTPLPQKWATLSHDGSFAVFEAGLYSNRHIYLVMKKGDGWMEKAVRITEAGTYNSSPEIDPTGQWLYFESNRDGSKGIWRAKLDWEGIRKQTGM